MKVTIRPTRNDGVARDRQAVQRSEGHAGELEIKDTADEGLKRIVKLAKLTTTYQTYELFEAHVVWVSENRMCLSGFERVKKGGRMVEYTQSWICTVDKQDYWRRR
jgi:hypothetical protein